MKTYFQKQQPKIIKYRSYKKIDNNLFRNDPLNKLLSKKRSSQTSYLFKTTAEYIVDRHVPLKEKQVRCNQAAFANKNRRKTIMTRSRLLNKFRHERTIPSDVACKNNKI